jgi:hypothetical protein
MPGARFFFLSQVLLFVLPDGRAGGVHYLDGNLAALGAKREAPRESRGL